MTARARTYKFATIKKEAEKRSAKRTPRPDIPPFVIDDVTPPITITAPDTVERQLIIADLMGDGTYNIANSLPLLKVLCGDQFPRVWALVKDDKDPEALIGVIQAITSHFETVIADAMGAQSEPGGSEDSSN